MGIGNPYDIRNRAMNDLIKVYSSTFASGIKRFTMRYRFKKDRQQSITIKSKHWDRKKVSTFFCGSRLVMNKLGEFYLCIPRPLELRTENQGLLIVNEEQRRTRLNTGGIYYNMTKSESKIFDNRYKILGGQNKIMTGNFITAYASISC
ncbi:hypothetical protein RhiirA5_379415 [Rhizophagus irregularis]|uniref:Uncharacterized protein n=1 Tax=Rhizophagus irregularis TaxID=588596 RepID=A0A2N0PC29_9GLOM|nr:hypothetical protein RhiirA5_379415 [Rhizophagus irregularis]